MPVARGLFSGVPAGSCAPLWAAAVTGGQRGAAWSAAVSEGWSADRVPLRSVAARGLSETCAAGAGRRTVPKDGAACASPGAPSAAKSAH